MCSLWEAWEGRIGGVFCYDFNRSSPSPQAPAENPVPGGLIAVPVRWFNNGLFKQRFNRPRETFLVAVNEYVCFERGKVSVLVLGDGPESSFEQSFKFNVECRQLWIQHGCPMVPAYTLHETSMASWQTDTEWFNLISDSDDQQKSKPAANCREIPPQYQANWQAELGMERLQRRNSTFLKRQQPQRALCNAVNGAVSRLVSSRDPWKWSKNSCHLDTFLMVELATYSMWCTCDETLSDEDIWPSLTQSEWMQRLMAVLLNVGTANQNALRDKYRAYESAERTSSSGAGPGMTSFDSVDNHEIILHDAEPTRTTVKLPLDVVCTHGSHAASHACRNRDVVKVAHMWFSLPDKWVPTKSQNGRWAVDAAGRIPHTSMADALTTFVVRSDARLKACTECQDAGRGIQFRTEKKRPQKCLLPPVLVFDMSSIYNTDKEINPEETLVFGGHTYALVSIVFGGKDHFNCRVRLQEKWFDYDDMAGIKSSRCTRRLLTTGTYGRQYNTLKDCFKTSCPKVSSYRYVRTQAFNERPRNAALPADPNQEYPMDQVQFEDMCAVVDGATT